MKALSDVKLKYLIDKIKAMFAPKEHTHESVAHADTASEADKLSKPTLIWADLSFDINNIQELDGTKPQINVPVKGVLPPENGGTGKTSLYEAAKAMQQYLTAQSGSNIFVHSYQGDGKFGINDPNTVEVPFFPKLMFISSEERDYVNIIPFLYYPADDTYPEESVFESVFVHGIDRCATAQISGEYSDGILSWYCISKTESYLTASTTNGRITTVSGDITDDDKAAYQQNSDGVTYWCYIFG